MSPRVSIIAIAFVFAACGPEAEQSLDAGTDAATRADAGGLANGGDAGGDAGNDGGGDAGDDAGASADAGESADGGGDAGEPDAGEPDAGTPVTCSMCHGSAASPAPPRSLDGGTLTTDRAVGAHQSHLKTGSSWHRDVQCADCHVVPASVGDATHIGAAPAEVTFSALAGQGVSAVWSGVNCTVYCHGATLAGGINTQPNWTTVNGTQAACGTCHSLPPGGNHPGNSTCGGCHSPVMNPDNITFKNPALHINGVVDR